MDSLARNRLRAAGRLLSLAALALAAATCDGDGLTDPLRRGRASLSFGWAADVPGAPQIPVDTLQIILRRPSESQAALDTSIGIQPDTLRGDTVDVNLAVPLRESPEDFILTVRLRGGGVTWYEATSNVRITAGAVASPTVQAQYIGPGAAAASVQVGPLDTTVAGGETFALQAVVYDSGGNPMAGVPVGYRLSDSTRGTVSYLSPYAATFTGAIAVRDSIWVVARTPTGLTDSTRVFIVPRAARLSVVSGSGQGGPIGSALAQPLVVRVLDELNGGFRGKLVSWGVTGGTATLSTTSVVSDDTGYAAITVTPTSLGGITVQASASGLVGTPQTVSFGITGAPSGPSAISIVSGDNQVDTVGRALPQPLVVRVTNALGDPVASARVAWATFQGGGSPGADTTLTDALGLTQVTYTLGPTPGADSIRATEVVSTASVVFAATGVTGGVRQVVLDRTVDTIPRGDSVQYTATLRDSAGNVVSGPVTWSSTAPPVATVTAAGLARSVGGGVTTIVAASGGYADSATLYVSALISVVVSPADTVVTAVGDSLVLTATGFDNFDDTLSAGVVIRFSSATPAIATVNAITGRVNITGAGNAVILARDSATGVVGSATVRVNQVVTGIVNTPADSIQVGVSGRGQIQARALDRNAYPIAGKTFGWRSQFIDTATVDVNGVVTGVGLGHTFVIDSLVDSTGVFKDSVLVSVVPTPPALIQWAFDSIAVGNGGNTSVALSLSRTDPSPFIVSITSSDTLIARPQSRSVTFPANTSGQSVVINGLASGRVTLVASDSTGPGYFSDTMVVTVVSTIEFREIGQFFRQTSFYVNQGETHRAQVFLSDPAPAGGLGVTFVYGRGSAAVTPSPAIIPAGQLAADVVIEGLSPGRDSVVPTSGGFVGRFSYVDVAPNSLQVYLPFPYTLGVGQTFQPYVQMTYSMDHPLVVATSLSPAIGTTPDTVTINTGTYYRYFPITATAPGVATLTASAPGWASGSATVTFTTPRLGVSGTGSMVAGDPSRGSWSAYAQDSLRYGHNVVDTVTVSAVSRNPAAVAVDVPAGNILPGQSGTTAGNALRALPTAGGDSAWIVLSAPGYQPDSFLVRVQAPALAFYLTYPYQTGVGTIFTNAGYVQIPYVRPDTLAVVFAHSRRGIVSGPDTVRILPGTTYQYFDIVGDSLGQDVMRVTAPGYVLPDSQVFNVVPIHVAVYSAPSVLYTISRPSVVRVSVRDSTPPSYSHNLVSPLRVNLTSSDTGVVTLDSAALTIPAGQYVSDVDTLRVRGTGVARVHTSAPGSSPDSSNVITVNPTPLTLALAYPYAAGQGLKLQNSYVYLPDYPPDTVRVAIQRYNPAVDSLSTDTLKIPPSTTYSPYFEIVALDSAGTDSITATATGFVGSSATFTAVPAQIDVQDFGVNHLTTEPPLLVSAYTRMRPAPGYAQNTVAPVTFTITSSDSSVIQIDSAGSVSPTAGSGSSTVPANQYYGYFKVRFVGSGSARIRVSAPGFATDSTQVVTVTGPTLRFGYTTVTVGANQVFPYQYVYVDNPVQGADLVVRLARSDSTLSVDSQAFHLSEDSLVIPVGFTSSPAVAIIGNLAGTANLIGRAAGYSQALALVAVGQPALQVPSTLPLFIGSEPVPVAVYTLDQSGNYRVVAAPTAVTSVSSDPAVAAPDSATRTIPAADGVAYFDFRGFQKGAVAVVFSAPSYRPDTMQVSVDTAKLELIGPPQGPGPGQVSPTDLYVQLPYATEADLVVTLTSTDPAVLTVPATLTIPAANYYVYIPMTGTGLGTTEVIATAPHSRPDTITVTTAPPRLALSLSSATSAGQPTPITVYAQDSSGTNRNVTSPLTVTLSSSVPGYTNFAANPVTIPAGTYFVTTTVTFDTAGSYTVTASASGYTNGTANTTTTGALVRMQTGDVFSPQSVTIQAGQYITWRNTDAIAHTTTSDSPNWDSGSVAAGATYQRYFSAQGTFAYHCNFHPGMTGTVTVNP